MLVLQSKTVRAMIYRRIEEARPVPSLDLMDWEERAQALATSLTDGVRLQATGDLGQHTERSPIEVVFAAFADVEREFRRHVSGSDFEAFPQLINRFSRRVEDAVVVGAALELYNLRNEIGRFPSGGVSPEAAAQWR